MIGDANAGDAIAHKDDNKIAREHRCYVSVQQP